MTVRLLLMPVLADSVLPTHAGLLSLAIPPWLSAMSTAMVSATAMEETASSA